MNALSASRKHLKGVYAISMRVLSHLCFKTRMDIA
ncbi:MAG: hypothetical protein RL341_2379 [Pseudomonadota bacterium]